MNWLIIPLIVLALIALVGWVYFLSDRNDFWRVAAGNANLAVALLALERDCLVGTEPAAGREREYAGPFTLRDTMGQSHRVYISHAHLTDVQTRIAQKLHGAPGNGHPQARGALAHATAFEVGSRLRRPRRGF